MSRDGSRSDQSVFSKSSAMSLSLRGRGSRHAPQYAHGAPVVPKRVSWRCRERRRPEHGSVVDEQVEPTQLAGRLDEPAPVLRVGHIAGKARTRPP